MGRSKQKDVIFHMSFSIFHFSFLPDHLPLGEHQNSLVSRSQEGSIIFHISFCIFHFPFLPDHLPLASIPAVRKDGRVVSISIH